MRESLESNVKTQLTETARVVSAGIHNTATVSFDRLLKHTIYSKYISRTSKFMVHDEKNECHVGDTVSIAECRPISRHKAWRLVEIVERAAGR